MNFFMSNQFEYIEVNKALRMDPDRDPNCLLGKRFLCRGSGGIIVGESGAGKSSFALQFACYLAVGKSFFGIKHPTDKPLRVMLVQAENDALEVAEVLQSIIEAEQWDKNKQNLLNENLHIYCSWDEGGEKFVEWLGGLAHKHKIDIAFIDPLMSFCGCDVSNNKDMGIFLRQNINSQLKKVADSKRPEVMNFGLIVVHHTGKKGSKTDILTSYDMMGASELTNWARFIMHLSNSKLSTNEQRVFDITITKRGNRSGVKNEGGRGENKLSVQYSSKKGIKVVKGKRSSGTGLDLIHWEKYKPLPPKPVSASSSGANKRVRPKNPRTKAGRAEKAAKLAASK